MRRKAFDSILSKRTVCVEPITKVTKSTNNRLSLWLTNVYHDADEVMMRSISVEDVGFTLVGLLTNCVNLLFFMILLILLLLANK